MAWVGSPGGAARGTPGGVPAQTLAPGSISRSRSPARSFCPGRMMRGLGLGDIEDSTTCSPAVSSATKWSEGAPPAAPRNREPSPVSRQRDWRLRFSSGCWDEAVRFVPGSPGRVRPLRHGHHDRSWDGMRTLRPFRASQRRSAARQAAAGVCLTGAWRVSPLGPPLPAAAFPLRVGRTLSVARVGDAGRDVSSACLLALRDRHRRAPLVASISRPEVG
jgi:hypothetical protein